MAPAACLCLKRKNNMQHAVRWRMMYDSTENTLSGSYHLSVPGLDQRLPIPTKGTELPLLSLSASWNSWRYVSRHLLAATTLLARDDDSRCCPALIKYGFQSISAYYFKRTIVWLPWNQSPGSCGTPRKIELNMISELKSSTRILPAVFPRLSPVKVPGISMYVFSAHGTRPWAPP